LGLGLGFTGLVGINLRRVGRKWSLCP